MFAQSPQRYFAARQRDNEVVREGAEHEAHHLQRRRTTRLKHAAEHDGSGTRSPCLRSRLRRRRHPPSPSGRARMVCAPPSPPLSEGDADTTWQLATLLPLLGARQRLRRCASLYKPPETRALSPTILSDEKPSPLLPLMAPVSLRAGYQPTPSLYLRHDNGTPSRPRDCSEAAAAMHRRAAPHHTASSPPSLPHLSTPAPHTTARNQRFA